MSTLTREQVQELLYCGDSDEKWLSNEETVNLLAHDAALRQQCSRKVSVEINGVGYCKQHAKHYSR